MHERSGLRFAMRRTAYNLIAWMLLTGIAVGDEATIRQIETILRPRKDSLPFREKLGRIVRLNDVQSSLLSLVKEERSTGLCLLALGFVVTPTDRSALTVLEEMADGDDLRFRREARDALLRVGGSPARRFLSRLLSRDRYEEQARVVGQTWLLRDTADLAYAATLFETVLKRHPAWKIAHDIKNSALPRIRTVLAIRRETDPNAIRKRLVDLLHGRDLAFVTVSGGVSQIWALRELAVLRLPESVRAVRAYVARLDRELRTAAPHVRHAALETLVRLRATLTDKEKEWLRTRRGAGTPLQLLRTVKDLEPVKIDAKKQQPGSDG